ncbi:glutaredoxin domain-containing protein [Sphingomonas sp.]|uniref:glutaredoxin domain-containing protein n=1 Tax=Sphingomonas sp. TaxID=28214 RepID=UPI0025CDCABF|nr:glutaredoxin domain-containing protein [Sphingomonas sp.]MBV9529061.1 glutathione S-transferase N-terminal domain-containing protein [Sphingomonas sp.]
MADPKVILYRMVLPDHVCPYGVRAKQLLEEAGIPFEDRILGTRMEVEAFKDEHKVDTTPQVIIDGKRIGGSDDLERYLLSAGSEA